MLLISGTPQRCKACKRGDRDSDSGSGQGNSEIRQGQRTATAKADGAITIAISDSDSEIRQRLGKSPPLPSGDPPRKGSDPGAPPSREDFGDVALNV